MSYEVYLKKNEEKRIVAGHSWVYANEVARIEGKDKNGSLASVYSSDGKFIGKGYINHASKILVRIFIRGNGTDDREFYMQKLTAAWEYRKKLGYENCCRVVFAEADGLPALIVDKYGDYLSVQCLSLGIDQRKKLITDCLVEIFHPKGIYERSDVTLRKKEGLAEVKGVLYGEVPELVGIEENGLKMFVDIINGQKTGYFLDQKENRFAARRYAAGGEVLDCFCNSGGFTVNCAATARHVTACDISQPALDSVMRNARANGLSNIDTLCGDAFALLRDFRRAGKKFDLVILDPPAFCKTADEVKDACRGYKDINIQGMKLVKSGGFLITCSCSHYMSPTLFERMLAEAAKESGRTVRCVEVRTQAPDHPALLCADETHYLKFYVLNVE
ncbi:MAG TPA: class I SAM-dependent rRNA methyltransferase [Candidatus Coproplasma avistercoris]|nr:class I SAM-dependent rRNA methyltransferase [Candidatus Coproplasma avistercoris]